MALLIQACGAGPASSPAQQDLAPSPRSPQAEGPPAASDGVAPRPPDGEPDRCALELRAEFDELTGCTGALEAELQGLAKPMRLRLPKTAQIKPCWRGGGSEGGDQGASALDPVDASILSEPIALETCRPEHPIARILRIVSFHASMRMDFNVKGRDLGYLLDRCGDGGDATPRVRLEHRVAHELAPDLTFCQAEFSGDPDDPDPGLQLHQILTIRGRKTRDREDGGEVYEYVGFNFHVPEADWQYVAELVRASARSFIVDWDALDARAKRTLEIDRARVEPGR